MTKSESPEKISLKRQPEPRPMIRWIMAGVLVWGCYLALGAVLGHATTRDLVKAGLILAFVVAFVGIWRALLMARAN